ncbi:heterokaryon incompatibility protein Het-C-domain-containing protein [Rhizoctonia solani]|nr:heterokaryon incompatibility protein Het-C-domain-containing protein [Rhizoctonia solani]
MYSLTTTLLVVVVLCALIPNVAAFGAGDIPDYAYLNDKAFRHGDIESILSQLSKNVGSSGFGGGVAGILVGVAKAALRGGKGDRFTSLDVKRVYFGNWLRDYSQAMDIAGLSKLTAQSLVTVVSVLGFMTFGFATEEFEVTPDRLGVYLPVEHIDNPKGYAEKEGDARQFHPKLRPPVDNRELEIDQNTGMKNYIATEGQSWDTSTAHVRRTLEACIQRGRKANGLENSDMWEAFRLLGTALHTLEDLLAHSNWCELGLLKMGHSEVFCHVGDNVKVNSPNGPVPPLITGTFGSADFMHSMLGEATDHLSEASVSDLSKKMSEMKNQDQSDSPIAKLRAILGKIPSGGGDQQQGAMEQGDQIRAKAFDFNPDDVAPEEVQQRLLEVLKWHDQAMHDITKTIQGIPGLETLLDELTNAMNAYVYTTLEPWLTPILQQTTGALQEGSAAVIDSDDQYEVFNNPDASDPSHSLLSKDHFGLILNEPAGKIAMIVVRHTVQLIVEAWYDHNKDVGATINQVMEAFHHPHYASGNSQVQNEMYEELTRWFGGLGESEGQQTIQLLTKESVRDGRNKRVGSEDSTTGGGYGGHGHSQQSGGHGQQSGGYGGQSGGQGQSGGYGEQQFGGYGGHSGGYGGSEELSSRSGYGDNSQSTYGRNEGSYARTEESSYGGGHGRSNDEYGSRSEEPRHSGYNPSYGGGDGGYGSRHDDEGGYSSRRNDDEGGYGSRRHDDEGGYGSRRHDDEGEHGSRRNDDEGGYGGGYSSHRNDDERGYGGGHGSRRNDDEGGYGSRHEGGYNPSYGGGEESYGQREQSHGGGYDSNRRDDETFGAERLNLGDDNEGYGGSGYGSGRRHQGYNPDY